ncbi:MAG: NAD-glutamate dehydrogenase [Salinisphaeraceae bacterium]|nr:NAD-glutamate dehydrogenase [Salinisphaeraceae bacterium]
MRIGEIIQAGAASSVQPEGRRELFDQFLRAYYATAHPELLLARTPGQLWDIAVSHWKQLQQSPESRANLSVAPAREAIGRFANVTTTEQDMAFLVDTVSMAVRDAGATVDWLHHPVLAVGRGVDGGVERVAACSGAHREEGEESLIHLEFLPPAGDWSADLEARLRRNLADLRVVTGDWQPMRRRLQAVIDEFENPPSGVDAEECAELQDFLRWLVDDHFTFLGYRQRGLGADAESLENVPGSSLGLLREDLSSADPDGYVAPAAELDKYALSARLLVVTKANTRAWIHHADYMDVIAIKRLDESGNVIGAHRFLGLFSSEAYASSPRSIPMLRRKVKEVTTRAALRPNSHLSKTLRYILETFPRDEIFQSGEEELYDTAMGVLGLRESQRLRLFMRRDRYGRFFSCMVYVPRDRYSLAVRQHLSEVLGQLLEGRCQEANSQFLRGGLVRMHIIIATPPGSESDLNAAQIEQRLLEVTRTWGDDFMLATGELDDADLAAELRHGYAWAFSAGYMERYPAQIAVRDARVLESLDATNNLAIRLNKGDDEQGLRLMLYGFGQEIILADVLPLLENFGLRIRTQRPFRVQPAGGQPRWMHEYYVIHERAVQALRHAELVQEAFMQTWQGQAESDGLNALVLDAGLDGRRVALLRAIARYLLQTELPYSRQYLEQIFTRNAALTGRLVDYFHARFDPDGGEPARRRELELVQTIGHALDELASLDADRVLRSCFGVMLACVRTNFFQQDEQGRPRPYISLKIESARAPELPRPLPLYETFVYSPDVEGIHLRGGKVARGGLRWSDRREDFRTEVLGLMKAQMVKNAVIVPVGAKGGFVVKNSPPGESREARQARGVACYKTFIRGLLDITDNRIGSDIKPPQRVRRFDDDDPYLVVAADKGTATFSDIANGLSREYDFWLDDAFASGGSAGYDHKAMGITARGAWEGVKRHFREQGHNIQTTPFTVVGIGDMSGDVFGNGMLLSEQIRLVAAFNHLHIFIDPDPDPATSFAERKRLFDLGRSGWPDYDESLISAGGGVFSRSDKIIPLSPQVRAALNISEERLTPTELISAILKAPVDLLWNGGIGTYVKASTESDVDVGDRANDALRVNGKALRCRAVGEGGNLGLTQAGRIEYARAGGRINTDAIDNSGGVDSSDLEVNIKIGLGVVEADGRLAREQRNELLRSMQPRVADLVLQTNYLQTQLISVLETDAVTRFDEHINFIRGLERQGMLDRGLEFLPDEEGVEQRLRDGHGLSRPELAVLISYGKLSLYGFVIDSALPDEAPLETVLFEGFPEQMCERYPEDIRAHRLRREIIATLATNRFVDRMGPALAHRLASERGVDMASVVKAFLLANAVCEGEQTCNAIEALDNEIDSDAQYQLLKQVSGLIKHLIGTLLHQADFAQRPMSDWLAQHQSAAHELLHNLPDWISPEYRQAWEGQVQTLTGGGVPDALARRLASVSLLGGLLDVVELAEDHGVELEWAARLYFQVGEEVRSPWLLRQIQAMQAQGRWQALARASLRDDCYRSHRQLTAAALASAGDSPQARLESWRARHAAGLAFVRERLHEIDAGDQISFQHLTVAVRDLAHLGG